MGEDDCHYAANASKFGEDPHSTLLPSDVRLMAEHPFDIHPKEVISEVLRMSDGIFPGGLVIFKRYPRDIQFRDRAVPRMSVGPTCAMWGGHQGQQHTRGRGSSEKIALNVEDRPRSVLTTEDRCNHYTTTLKYCDEQTLAADVRKLLEHIKTEAKTLTPTRHDIVQLPATCIAEWNILMDVLKSESNKQIIVNDFARLGGSIENYICRDYQTGFAGCYLFCTTNSL
ncbi:hypothetical protein OUZ56_009532 [Daphnia magna]|uniref:Uncharacterized protein n=1 Tax=Daphnia magna TaxID=35525 RepID=A0ABR0AGE4_9CRUS|nr:hypothetical protein OUZ56_009532 [Daphnia magna]